MLDFRFVLIYVSIFYIDIFIVYRVIHDCTDIFLQSGSAIQCKCDVVVSSDGNDKIHQNTTDQNT